MKFPGSNIWVGEGDLSDNLGKQFGEHEGRGRSRNRLRAERECRKCSGSEMSFHEGWPQKKAKKQESNSRARESRKFLKIFNWQQFCSFISCREERPERYCGWQRELVPHKGGSGNQAPRWRGWHFREPWNSVTGVTSNAPWEGKEV